MKGYTMAGTPKKPVSMVPTVFMPILRWLRDRRGIDLFARINITRPIRIDGVDITGADIRRLKELLLTDSAESRPKDKKSKAKQGETLNG